MWEVAFVSHHRAHCSMGNGGGIGAGAGGGMEIGWEVVWGEGWMGWGGISAGVLMRVGEVIEAARVGGGRCWSVWVLLEGLKLRLMVEVGRCMLRWRR